MVLKIFPLFCEILGKSKSNFSSQISHMGSLKLQFLLKYGVPWIYMGPMAKLVTK